MYSFCLSTSQPIFFLLYIFFILIVLCLKTPFSSNCLPISLNDGGWYYEHLNLFNKFKNLFVVVIAFVNLRQFKKRLRELVDHDGGGLK